MKYSSPKKYAAKNLPRHSVREIASGPTWLMTELALRKKSKITRETVRNAIRDLEVSDLMQRIPKNGIYSYSFFCKQASKQASLYK